MQDFSKKIIVRLPLLTSKLCYNFLKSILQISQIHCKGTTNIWNTQIICAKNSHIYGHMREFF